MKAIIFSTLFGLVLTAALHAEGLTKEQAHAAIQQAYKEAVDASRGERQKELDEKSITLGGLTMRWLEKVFGKAPESGRSLWISLHGGGGAPAAVNDQQWQNQIHLYQPDEGIYIAPRAPTDTWNLWHEAHIDDFFNRLIEDFVALRGVDPDKVYLMGYSAGGDGVWQLGPRMADRWAAASMMAGHPNDARLESLRNLPFALFVGGEDSAYDRNKVVSERGEQLDKLAAADPGGYTHLTRVYPGLGHWMNLKDAESVPWMAQFTRHTWPKSVVWMQSSRLHQRFYWLHLDPAKPAAGTSKPGQLFKAEVKGQAITLSGDIPTRLHLWLSDELLDLDQPLTITLPGGKKMETKAERSSALIKRALSERLDPKACPVAELVLP